MKPASNPIVVEQSFSASAKSMWAAITHLSQMKQWFFENIPAFEPEVGFSTQFTVHTPNRDFVHLWEILEVIPYEKIVYSWKYAGFTGEGIVSFELFPSGNQTLLKLTSEGGESFPQDIPEFKRESGVKGWNYFIKNRLKECIKALDSH